MTGSGLFSTRVDPEMMKEYFKTHSDPLSNPEAKRVKQQKSGAEEASSTPEDNFVKPKRFSMAGTKRFSMKMSTPLKNIKEEFFEHDSQVQDSPAEPQPPSMKRIKAELMSEDEA